MLQSVTPNCDALCSRKIKEMTEKFKPVSMNNLTETATTLLAFAGIEEHSNYAFQGLGENI